MIILLAVVCFNCLGQTSSTNTKYDIAFVLRGYDSSCYYCDSVDFDEKAKEIVGYLNKLSFGQIATYRIFTNGVDSRSVVNLQSAQDINTLQAALNGWPGTQWDWLRNRTDYWAIVPDNYRPIVLNAINWMRSTKLDLQSWGTSTAEGLVHYTVIQNNIGRMGPSSAADFLKELKMPKEYNPADFKYTEIILSSLSNSAIVGAGAQNSLMSFGLLDFNGNAYTNFMSKATYVFYSPRDLLRAANGTYTSIHEGVHALGMGTHDVDDQERNLSVMSSNGSVESFSMLPAWNRYYWTKWLLKSTITSDSSQVADLKGKGLPGDASFKYIHELIRGDSLGRGGTYREKYDGRWYSYTVDNGGTLRFTSSFKNENNAAPINALIDVPVVKKVGDTVSFYVRHDGNLGAQLTYQWYKDGVLLAVGSKYTLNGREFKINGVTKADEGLYNCVVQNSFGNISSRQVKMYVPIVCSFVAPPVITNSQINVCQNTVPAALSATPIAGNTLRWYGISASGGTASPNPPTASTTTTGTTNYYVSQITTNGCESERSVIAVTVHAKPAIPAVSNSAICQGDLVTALAATASGSNILRWYGTNATGGISSSSAPTPSSGIAGVTNYYVSQISAQGCESDRSTLIFTVHPKPVAPTISNLSVCTGTATSALTAMASSGHTLRWYGTNATGGTATTTAPSPSTATAGVTNYYVSQISAQGCESDRANLVFTVNVLPAKPNISWNGTQLSTATGLAAYQWLLNNTAVIGATSNTHQPQNAGSYKVRVANTAGCADTSTAYDLVVTALATPMFEGKAVSIYPNPVVQSAILDFGQTPQQPVTLQLLHMNGAAAGNWTIRQRKQELLLGHLPAGMYLLQIQNGRSKTVIPVLKQHR